MSPLLPPPVSERPQRIKRREVSYDGGETWRDHDPKLDGDRKPRERVILEEPDV